MDAIVECSAEPSALAGRAGDTAYVVGINLLGAQNCLELARRDDAQFVFLSTSRVYPFDALDARRLSRGADTRFELEADQELPGHQRRRGLRGLPARRARARSTAPPSWPPSCWSTEYRAAFGLRTVIDRCGVIAGPWQMGKVDQGVFTYWVLSHYFGRELSYIGYGGARQAGARPAARRRPGRPGRGPARCAPTTGTA